MSDVIARITIPNCQSHKLGKCDSHFKAAVVGVDGKRIPRDRREPGEANAAFVELLPGKHTLNIVVRWSNGAISAAPLTLNVEPAGLYQFYVYEAGDPAELASTSLANPERRPPVADTWRRGAAETLFYSAGLILAPIIVPLAVVSSPLIYAGIKHEQEIEEAFRNTRADTGTVPFPGCCRYWIEDGQGQVVAGEKVSLPEAPK